MVWRCIFFCRSQPAENEFAPFLPHTFGHLSDYVILKPSVRNRGNNRLHYFFAGLLALDAAAHLYACVNRNMLMLRRVSKCLLMPLLAVCYLLFAASPSPLVFAAILFGFAGDLVLLFRPRRWAFPVGILAFAAGHVCYIISFAKRIATAPPWYMFVLCALITIACAGILTRYLWKGLPKKLRPPSFLYMLVIGSMASCAVLFTLYGATAHRWLAAIGGLLFALSDSILSIDAFHHPIRHRSILVMSTYIAAQTLIVSALAFS